MCFDWTERGLQDPTPAQLSKGRCPEDPRPGPDTEPQTRLQRVGNVPALPSPCSSTGLEPEGVREPAPRSPPARPAPAPRAPGMRRGRGCVGAGAAAEILHPSRFCLPRANSRGLKFFHLERQSAFFLSIPGQTPMVPRTSLLPNGGAAFSFRLRVILLALLCWNIKSVTSWRTVRRLIMPLFSAVPS